LLFIEFSLVRIVGFGLSNERNKVRHEISVARIVNESFLDEKHVFFSDQFLEIVVIRDLRKENAVVAFFNFKRNALVEVDFHIGFTLLDFHFFSFIWFGVMVWLNLFIKEHVSVARLGITSTKALALDNLGQVNFGDGPVVELVPFSLPVDVRVVMACLC
jgi:hypothetical protein